MSLRMFEKLKGIKKSERLLISVIFIVFIAVLAVTGILFYRYISKQLYNESVSQIDEISSQFFEKMDVQLEYQWMTLEKMEKIRNKNDTMTQEELADMFANCEEYLGLAGKTVLFRAIDEEGYYYTKEGRQGLWTGLDKLTENDRQCFLISNWLDSESYMAFTVKPQSPLAVDSHKITHFVLLRSMSDMQPFFESSVFKRQNALYIIEYDGTLLFENGGLDEVDFEGQNVFRNMEKMTYPHMGSFDAVRNAYDMKNSVCTDVVISGNKFYMVYDLLPKYDWGLIMLVPDEDVASSTNDMVNSIIRLFIMLIGFILTALIIGFFLIFNVHKNRSLLAIKAKNEKRLEEANLLLEKTNLELQKSQTVAEEASKAKSRFLANMSHDIRTPMNAIVGISKLLEADSDDPDKRRRYIKKLQHSGQYMLGLINDILDMSKIESGEVRLNLEPIKLAEQVGRIESIIRSQCNERKQEFTVCVHEVVHEYLIGDSVRLQQIFLNLLSNAVKYTPEGGSIRFEIAELPCDEEDCASILTSVIDNGIGMSGEFVKHIFEPFVREENSVVNKVQGTGLGMSITKSLVDLMGGTIKVESKPNEGSRFDVLLTVPIDREAMSESAVKDVLLISDEDMLVCNVKAALREEPAELRIASTPDEAVSMLSEKKAETILLSGYIHNETLTETVRLLRETAKDAALIFCCDYAYKKHMHDVLTGSGVDGFIPRPFFYENLLLAIKQVYEKTSPYNHTSHSYLNGKRFLCAEDNELNAEILKALLNIYNASCTIYSNGAELVKAFETVKPEDYDAVLMDIQMPVMNGMDATRAIRNGKNPLGKTIPIIAMTANAYSSDVQECRNAGMDAHLAKPLDIIALERTLQELLSGNFSGGGTLRYTKTAAVPSPSRRPKTD